MAWAYFQNQGAWDAYHNAVCAAQGIPYPGRRQSDGVPQILKQWVDCWTTPIQVKASGNVTAWVAWVPDTDVVTYDLGLNLPDSDVTFNPDGRTVTFTFNRKTYTGQLEVGFNWRKQKPARVTVDGMEYDTITGERV